MARDVGAGPGTARPSKDVRPAVLLLRASTRLQGMTGFVLGLRLLIGLLDGYWDGIHPKLDADDDNDPTMRLNALAPLTDEGMVLRDLYDASVGMARGVGAIRVRDIAIAHNALTAIGSEAAYSPAQVQGALAKIHAETPELLQILIGIPDLVTRLQTLSGRTHRPHRPDRPGATAPPRHGARQGLPPSWAARHARNGRRGRGRRSAAGGITARRVPPAAGSPRGRTRSRRWTA